MEEPIIYRNWATKPVLKKPAQSLYDRLGNALRLDDKEEFFRVISDPEFDPTGYTVNVVFAFPDQTQIAIAALNGETRGLLKDPDADLVFTNGWTPVHLFTANPSPCLINYLIQRGDPIDVPCDCHFLNLKHATPLDLTLEVIDTYYCKHFLTDKPWTPRNSIFELFNYVCCHQRRALEVLRLLLQNTKDKEPVRKAFLDYAHEGKFVKLLALFLAAPELFSSPSIGDGSMSSIDALYLNLNSLEKTTNIQQGLSLLLDVFASVGHMLIAYLRIDDPNVWDIDHYFNKHKLTFFLRETAHKKLGILSPDDYLSRLFMPVSQLKAFPFGEKNINHLYDYLVDHRYSSDARKLPGFNSSRQAEFREAIENRLSTMPNICLPLEVTTGIPKKGGNQRFDFPGAKRSTELMRAQTFCTKASNAKDRLDFKLVPGNGLKSRVTNPTMLESFFSAVRLSHFPVMAKRLMK